MLSMQVRLYEKFLLCTLGELLGNTLWHHCQDSLLNPVQTPMRAGCFLRCYSGSSVEVSSLVTPSSLFLSFLAFVSYSPLDQWNEHHGVHHA